MSNKSLVSSQYLKILLLLFLNVPHNSYSEEQWNSSKTNISIGYRYLSNGQIDNTTGFGAFDDLELKSNTRNIDVGGGKFDHNTTYLFKKYKIINVVYDPYNRSENHNQTVLKLAHKKPFDTATSISVLNVINNKKIRYNHIKLIFDSLHSKGKAYFKVYGGNHSGKEWYGNKIYQSNRGIETYYEEIAQIFGKKNTLLIKEKNLIIAVRQRNLSSSNP